MTFARQFIAAAEKRRKSLGWTKEGMCRNAGISKGAWSDYVNGKRDNLTAETIERVTGALSLRVAFEEI